MAISDLARLEQVATRALVVNFHTQLATTLALASLRSCAPDLPVLVVDLDPTSDSRRLFSRLSTEWAIDVVETPGQAHGSLLDLVVPAIRSEHVLLLDSDAELRDASFVDELHRSAAPDDVFGAGILQESRPFDAAELGLDRPGARDVDRCWMACALLDVVAVREALDGGQSFLARWRSVDPPVFADTGADLFEWLDARGWRFTALDRPLFGPGAPVRHEAGHTWRLLQRRTNRDEVTRRHARMTRALVSYGIDWSELGIPPVPTVVSGRLP